MTATIIQAWWSAPRKRERSVDEFEVAVRFKVYLRLMLRPDMTVEEIDEYLRLANITPDMLRAWAIVLKQWDALP